jgi:methylglyoxal reductase
MTIAQLAISWVISHKNTIALCGARNRLQAMENAKAGEIFLNEKEVETIKDYFN